jgi:hypothetical protein
MKMTTEKRDSTIADIHQIRQEIATKFQGDIFAITADAQARMETSGRRIIRRPKSPNKATPTSGGLETSQVDNPSRTPG